MDIRGVVLLLNAKILKKIFLNFSILLKICKLIATAFTMQYIVMGVHTFCVQWNIEE